MALLIEKNVTVLGDIDLSQLYLRLTMTYGPDGTSLIIRTDSYSSKNAYKSNVNNYFWEVDGIDKQMGIAYDRVVDGSDILTYAHDFVKTNLSTDVIIELPLMDPSTGQPVYIQEPVMDPSTGLQMEDPSTGELYWTDGDPSTYTEIDIPRFAMDTSIFIVDVSIL